MEPGFSADRDHIENRYKVYATTAIKQRRLERGLPKGNEDRSGSDYVAGVER